MLRAHLQVLTVFLDYLHQVRKPLALPLQRLRVANQRHGGVTSVNNVQRPGKPEGSAKQAKRYHLQQQSHPWSYATNYNNRAIQGHAKQKLMSPCVSPAASGAMGDLVTRCGTSPCEHGILLVFYSTIILVHLGHFYCYCSNEAGIHLENSSQLFRIRDLFHFLHVSLSLIISVGLHP